MEYLAHIEPSLQVKRSSIRGGQFQITGNYLFLHKEVQLVIGSSHIHKFFHHLIMTNSSLMVLEETTRTHL